MSKDKMVKLFNPHSQECSITYKDEPYTVAAGATVEVPEDAANYWVTYIHTFMVLGGEPVVVEPEEAVEMEESKVSKKK